MRAMRLQTSKTPAPLGQGTPASLPRRGAASRSQARAGCAPAQPQTKPPGQGAPLPAAPRGLPPLLLPVCSQLLQPLAPREGSAGEEKRWKCCSFVASPPDEPQILPARSPPRCQPGSSAGRAQPPPGSRPLAHSPGSCSALKLLFTSLSRKNPRGFPQGASVAAHWETPSSSAGEAAPRCLQEHLRAFEMLFPGHTAPLGAATATPARLSPATAPSSAPFPGQNLSLAQAHCCFYPATGRSVCPSAHTAFPGGRDVQWWREEGLGDSRAGREQRAAQHLYLQQHQVSALQKSEARA